MSEEFEIDLEADLESDPDELSDYEFTNQLTQICGAMGEIELQVQSETMATGRLAELRRSYIGKNEAEKQSAERTKKLKQLIERTTELKGEIPDRFSNHDEDDSEDTTRGFY